MITNRAATVLLWAPDHLSDAEVAEMIEDKLSHPDTVLVVGIVKVVS